jgi:hypothetical protein
MKVKCLFWLLLFALSFSGIKSFGQCKDVFAANFDPADSLSVNCKYPIAIQNPDFLFELPKEVEETSGLVFFDGLLWTHNDSGGEAALYGIDTVSGRISRKLGFPEISNIDWEAVALSKDYLFIGDFGNNNGSRKNLMIHRVERSAIPDSGNASLKTEVIRFNFEDQDDFTIDWKSNNFDCEALIAGDQNLYLFSKNRGDQHSRIYRLPFEPGEHIAQLIGRFDSQGLITGADYDHVHNQLVLVGYTYKTWKPFMWLFYGFENENFPEGNKRKIELPNLLTTQIEGITFISPWQVMISAESSKSFTARVFKMDLEFFLSPYSYALQKGELLTSVSYDAIDQVIGYPSESIKEGIYTMMIFDAENQVLANKTVEIEGNNQQLTRDLILPDNAMKAVLFGKRHIYYFNF